MHFLSIFDGIVKILSEIKKYFSVSYIYVNYIISIKTYDFRFETLEEPYKCITINSILYYYYISL